MVSLKTGNKRISQKKQTKTKPNFAFLYLYLRSKIYFLVLFKLKKKIALVPKQF